MGIANSFKGFDMSSIISSNFVLGADFCNPALVDRQLVALDFCCLVDLSKAVAFERLNIGEFRGNLVIFSNKVCYYVLDEQLSSSPYSWVLDREG